MHIIMAGATHHQGLPSAGGHHLDPLWRRASAVAADIPQVADVMALAPVVRTAELARLRQQALEEFGALALHCRRVGHKESALTPVQRYAAPGGHQGLLPLPPFHHDLQALPWTVGRLQPGLVALSLLDHA
jgi:hypothetical protein